MKRRYLIHSAILVLIIGGLMLPAPAAGEKAPARSESGNPIIQITIGPAKVKAELVTSMEKMYLGLGKRPELPEGQGMLFAMPTLAVQNFCMRDMRFDIDFIWIVSGRVAGITKNASHKDPLACYSAPEPVKFVLEVPAGFCDRYGIKVGDKAAWK